MTLRNNLRNYFKKKSLESEKYGLPCKKCAKLNLCNVNMLNNFVVDRKTQSYISLRHCTLHNQ